MTDEQTQLLRDIRDILTRIEAQGRGPTHVWPTMPRPFGPPEGTPINPPVAPPWITPPPWPDDRIWCTHQGATP